ncbi:MAG: hypothetical protein JW993_13135 [Sedimentisphaerales bacterium]|nr:hypothetical protein [Sedimentisphaerales bacterium]
MDHRSAIGTVPADQAVFTSVRSPMGGGYRIVAASPGVRADEKAEMTRRAPSHASLCGDGPDAVADEPDAVGLLAYPLASGRYCVALSQYAGWEHTARGGHRVHTHIVVLDRQAYLEFGCNAVRVHAALKEAVGGRPILKPPPKLGQLSLSPHPSVVSPSLTAPPSVSTGPKGGNPARGIRRDTDQVSEVRSRSLVAKTARAEARGSCVVHGGFGGQVSSGSPKQVSDARAEPVLRVVLAMLQGERTLVVGSHGELDLLDKVLVSLPLAVRCSLGVSAGLRYSPSRQLHLCLVCRDQGETQRAARGQNVQWLDIEALPACPSSPYDAWLNLTRRWLEAGRDADVEWLTTGMTDEMSPEALARTACICRAIDSVETASLSELAELIGKFVATVADSELEMELLRRLNEVAAQRRRDNNLAEADIDGSLDTAAASRDHHVRCRITPDTSG